MSYDSYTNIYAYVSRDNAQEVMARILAIFQEQNLFVSEDTIADTLGVLHLYCEDSNIDAEQYLAALGPIAAEYGIDIHIGYQSDYSDVETDQYFVGPNATALYAKEHLAKIKEAAVYLLRQYNHTLITDLAAQEGFNPTSLLSLLNPGTDTPPIPGRDAKHEQ